MVAISTVLLFHLPCIARSSYLGCDQVPAATIVWTLDSLHFHFALSEYDLGDDGSQYFNVRLSFEFSRPLVLRIKGAVEKSLHV
jgi:hypothetical protein